MVGQKEADLLQFDKFSYSTVANRQVGQQLQSFADYLLTTAPVLQIGDDLRTGKTINRCRGTSRWR